MITDLLFWGNPETSPVIIGLILAIMLILMVRPKGIKK